MATFKNKTHVVIPRWMILVTDQAIVLSSFLLSCLILKHFNVSSILTGKYVYYIFFYQLISLTCFFVMHIHTGLIRYSNMQDMLRIFTALFVCGLSFLAPVESYFLAIDHSFSRRLVELLLLNFFISSSMLILFRTGVKEVFNIAKNTVDPGKKRVLICGADEYAILVKHTLEASNLHFFKVMAFVDLSDKKTGGVIEQTKVIQASAVALAKRKLKIDQLLVTSDQLEKPETKSLIEECLRLDIGVLKIPSSDNWISGRLIASQINGLRIEDLLQREPIVIENERVYEQCNGKRVLVTGAAGSIGSEIVRQVLSLNPALIILFDQAETPLYNLQLEVTEAFPGQHILIYIGDVRKYGKLSGIFDEHKPQVVFHAAAYKHVPLMENNPCEAVLTNVLGTKNAADLALEHGSEVFVMISTDKAVAPANVMGATKRIAEIYVQSLHKLSQNNKMVAILKDDFRPARFYSKTNFVTTRFGNVLGSNGSVIPRFKEQIQSGGPVTVTHAEITRFFMTIPEAVSLVLEASTMGKGGEIFVFDMGKPVKIKDLALRMIELAGLVVGKDIDIKYTGLRPGEKLYEELLGGAEEITGTYHPLIKIARLTASAGREVIDQINDLLNKIVLGDTDERHVVALMKEIVHDFVSNNSRFEQLDKQSA